MEASVHIRIYYVTKSGLGNYFPKLLPVFECVRVERKAADSRRTLSALLSFGRPTPKKEKSPPKIPSPATAAMMR